MSKLEKQIKQVYKVLATEVMEKLYDIIYKERLSYEEIMTHYKNRFFTRKEWQGVHFMVDGDYYIITKDRTVLKNPKEIYNTKDNDWCLVVISSECLKIYDTIVGTEGVSYYPS